MDKTDEVFDMVKQGKDIVKRGHKAIIAGIFSIIMILCGIASMIMLTLGYHHPILCFFPLTALCVYFVEFIIKFISMVKSLMLTKKTVDAIEILNNLLKLSEDSEWMYSIFDKDKIMAQKEQWTKEAEEVGMTLTEYLESINPLKERGSKMTTETKNLDLTYRKCPVCGEEYRLNWMRMAELIKQNFVDIRCGFCHALFRVKRNPHETNWQTKLEYEVLTKGNQELTNQCGADAEEAKDKSIKERSDI